MSASEFPNVPTNAYPGQCRACERRRPVCSVSRSGGGTYRRGGRSYSSSICGECAVSMLSRANNPSQSLDRFSCSSISRVVEKIDTDEARAVYAAYRAMADAYFAESRARSERFTAQQAAQQAERETAQEAAQSDPGMVL